MKLLGTNASPYARKVRLVLLEKNIPHEYLIAPPREPSSQVALINPLGRIPALILDDETCVFDSPVIAEYVDTLNDQPALIPRTDALAKNARKTLGSAGGWHHGFGCCGAHRKPAPGRQAGSQQYHPAQQCSDACLGLCF